jgi:tRNA G37 N-methylase Trm5
VTAIGGCGGVIHFYDLVHAAKGVDPVEEIKKKVVSRMDELGRSYSVGHGRVVRSTGPRWHQVVLDIVVE